MKVIFLLALIAAQSMVWADSDSDSDGGSRPFHPKPAKCAAITFGKPLQDDTTFFNQFLAASKCVKRDDYLLKGEKARGYNGKLPDIPSVNIDSGLTAYFEEIVGPESIAIDGDTAYTGAADGWIYKIDLTTMNATRFATACSASGVTACRPLGIRATSDNKLYFADLAGLCTYDIASDKVTVLVRRLSDVEGATLTLPNDLDVDESTKMVYMSDGSTKYANTNILRGTLLHDNNGRVLAYNITTGNVSVLIRGLSFPNGIQLTHDKETLLVNELNKRRVLKVTLKGRKKGEYDVFTPELPGEPDNIRSASNGGYWVAINLARNGSEKSTYDYLSNNECATENFIVMNDFVAKYLRFVAKTTKRQDYNDVADRLSSYQFVSEMASHQGNIVRLDSTGKIDKRYTSEQYGFFSNPVEYKNSLIVGNDRYPKIVKIDGIL